MAFKYFPDETFAAGLAFTLDLQQESLHVVTCGINKFILLSDQQPQMIKRVGGFMGIFEDAKFEEYELRVKRGDSIFFISDGVYEALDEELVCGIGSYEEGVDLLAKTMNSYQIDDRTAICINIQP